MLEAIPEKHFRISLHESLKVSLSESWEESSKETRERRIRGAMPGGILGIIRERTRRSTGMYRQRNPKKESMMKSRKENIP